MSALNVVESRSVTVLKALIVVAAVWLFLAPLATPPGLATGLLGSLAGFVLANRVAARIRLASGLLVGAATVCVGQLFVSWLLDVPLGLNPSATLFLADALSLGLAALGGVFVLRLLSHRIRGFSVVEFALIVAAVAHTFANHRHQRIHQPRVLSDWAWSNGLDPQTILTALGAISVAIAALVLVRVRRGSRLLAMLLLLLLLSAGLASLFSGRVGEAAATDDLGLDGSKDDEKKDNQKPNKSSSSKPPDPVAVVVLHEDLPDADALYFRQSVRSRLVGDRLVADSSGLFDRDVPLGFPAGEPLKLVTPQAPPFHRRVRTSMYLLVDHAQLFGLSHPTMLTLLQNPNPRRFVAAYDVESLFLIRPIERLLGHQALPGSWSQAEREHYVAAPADPRYLALSNRLVRDVDPRFVGDDVMKALAIKQYLEQKGFYSLAEKALVGDDPTATFLFGDLRGYCVHFAHAAVFLLRSQGIPARVALGYGVQTRNRGAGSAVLIFSHEAHAWPELYLDGIGWVTFDIHPEKSDEPPMQHVDQDLESALGELARNDATGGKAPPAPPLDIPWAALFFGITGLALAMAYAIKVGSRKRRGSHRLIYRSVLDGLSDRGEVRHFGESRESHAARVARLAPSFVSLTAAHLRLAFRDDLSGEASSATTLQQLADATAVELRRNTGWFIRARAVLNPIGWWFTR